MSMTTTQGRLDPQGMIRTVEKRVARETDPRKIQMLQTLLAHMRAESAKDIDALLATVADAVHYHTWAPGGETQSPEGPAEVRAFYTNKAEEGFLDFQYDIERLLVDENVIVTEGVMVSHVPSRSLGAFGFPDTGGLVALSMRMTIFWPFDDEGLLLGEDSYSHVLGLAPVEAE